MAQTVIHARARNDDGNETTATWKAPEDQAWTQAVDTNFRYREKIQLDAAGAIANLDVQLQYSLNGGAFTNVTAASTVIRSSASPNLLDAANVTEQLSGGTGTFIGLTAFDEVNGICGGTSLDVANSGKFEVEFCVQLRSADVVRGDTIRLRTINSDTSTAWTTYNVTMTMTAIGAVPNVFDSVAAAEFIDLDINLNVNANEGVTAYDLSNQEINYWITVSDSTTVTLVTAVANLSVNTFDAVAAAELAAAMLSVRPAPFETVTAAESITVNLLEQPIVFDAITITESITPRLVIQPQPFESVTVAESITLTGSMSLSQFDAVTTAESITLNLLEQPNQFDAVTITEAITPRLFIQPNTFDAVTIVEAITLTSSASLTTFESVTVAEFAAVFLPKLNINTSDDLIITESANISLGLITVLFIDLSDTAATTESITVLLPKLNVSQNDTATIAESITLLLPVLFLSLFDSISIVENLTTQLVPRLTIDTSDSVAAAESITVSTTAAGMLSINTFEALTLAELGQGLLTKLFVTTNDDVSIAESTTQIVNPLTASVFDTATTNEIVSLQFSRLLIAADESVTIAEQVGIGFVAPLQINVGDLVRLLSIAPVDVNTVSDAISVSDFVTVVGPLLWASVGSLGSAGSKSANQASLTLVTTATLNVGNFAAVLIAVDNNATADGDEVAVTALVDSAGNTYLKAREFTNGQGAAQGGATISVWYCQATAQLNTGGTITASFSNATSRDASAISAFEFSTQVAGAITLAGSAVLANDASDPGSVDLTLTSGEYLWVRAQAHERPSTDVFTKTVAYAGVFDKNGTTGGTAATNMTVAGEFDVSLGTSNASNPAWSAAADEASILVAFKLSPSLAPSMVETVTLTEFVDLYLPRLFIDANDPVTLQDVVIMSLAGTVSALPVSTSDAVTLVEVLQVALSRLSINIFEAVTVAEFISNGASTQNLTIELGDAVATTENIIFRGALSISAFDFVFLLANPPVAITVVENLTITELVGALGPITVALQIGVFENVVVDIPETSVFESITVSELAQVIGTGIDWFSVGSLGSISSNSADQSSIVLQAGAVAEVGNVVVVLIAVDNAATSDGDEGAITGVTDAVGNTWVEVGEFTNANAAPQAGATIAAWYSLITTQIPINSLITATFSNPSSRDASALTAWEFGRRNSGAVTVAAVTTLANDNSDPGAMNLALGAGEHLWVRAQAHEGPLSDVWIKTIAYDGIFDKQGTTGGLAASNMTVAAEFRIFQGPSNPSDPSWTAAADEAGMLFALKLSASLAPSAADSVTIAELASLALARLTVNVNDNTNVLEAVTLKQTANVSVFETVSVPDFSALFISVQATGFDAVTLTESIALASQMSISAFDLVTVTEVIQVNQSAYLSVFDNLTVTDAASVPIPILLSTADTVTLAEATTVFLPKLVLSIFDTVTALDVSALFVQGTAPAPAAGDFIDAEDDATVSLNRLTLNAFDAVTAAESVTLLSQMSLTANDAVSVAEAITPRLSVYTSSFDAVTLADASVLVLNIPVTAFDTITMIEVPFIGSIMSLAANDNVTVAEQAIITSRALIIDLQEDLTVGELVAARFSLRINQFDALVLADSTAAIFTVQTIFIEQGDAVAIQEEINQEVRGDVCLATDVVLVDDFASLRIDRLKVQAVEDVAAIEDLTGRLSCYVSLAESVSVADTASYIFHGTTLTINLAEAVTVSDAFSTNLSLLKIVEVTSEIALEMNMQSGIATDLGMTSEINNDIDLEGEIEI